MNNLHMHLHAAIWADEVAALKAEKTENTIAIKTPAPPKRKKKNGL
jgi:hypothetical protein